MYLAGLAIGDADLSSRQSLQAFHEGLAAVADIGMFFALGLLVFPSQLGGVLVRGTLLALLLAFVARPVSAFAATVRQPLHRAASGSCSAGRGYEAGSRWCWRRCR